MKPRQEWPDSSLKKRSTALATNAAGTVLIVLLLAGCQQADNDTDSDTETDTEATESNAGDDSEEATPAIPVETASASRSDIFATHSGTAPVEAFADATVVAKVSGEIREIYVEEGDDVKAGQILARLDGDKLRLEQMQSEANLRKLQRDYQRNVDLNERGLISVGDFEKLRYEMEALEATNKLAKLQLSYADIRAPISGVVSERFIKTGNMLDLDAPAFQVTSLEPLISYLHVPEREFRRIVAGQDAMLVIDALGGSKFPAKVARVSPVVDPTTGTFKITIEISDPSRSLKPGMFARIAVVHATHANALQVPRSALVNEVDSTSLFVIEEEIAHKRVVETGFASDGQIEITDGLSDSDRFVIVGHSGLKDGSRVTVINGDDVEATTTGSSDAG